MRLQLSRTRLDRETGLSTSTKWIIGIGLPLIVLAALIVPNLAVNQVVSASMAPTINTGDHVLTASLFTENVERGQIIGFEDGWGWFKTSEFANDKNMTVMKRVIAIGGDTISSDGNTVYVNGEPVDEPYAYGTTGKFAELTVPPRTLFVMGDNRSESSDSRAHIRDSYTFIPLGWVRYHHVMTLWNSPLPGTGDRCAQGYLNEC